MCFRRGAHVAQLVAAYLRRTGIQISPLAQSMAAAALGIANPVAKKLISPEALSELMALGWPIWGRSMPRPYSNACVLE